MKLSRVTISNFRSVKEVTIDFDPRCLVLVGINESGKSNILNALFTCLQTNNRPKATFDTPELTNR